jgi:hypothetical protein
MMSLRVTIDHRNGGGRLLTNAVNYYALSEWRIPSTSRHPMALPSTRRHQLAQPGVECHVWVTYGSHKCDGAG